MDVAYVILESGDSHEVCEGVFRITGASAGVRLDRPPEGGGIGRGS